MARRLMEIRNRVSQGVEELQKEQLVSFEEYHRAERGRIAAKRLLSRINMGIEREQGLLCAAFGRPSLYGRCAVVLDGELKPPDFNGKPCDLEAMALQNRPEAFVAGLNHLNSVNGLRTTMVKYFPRVSLFWRHAGDKEKFLYHHDWRQVGFQIQVDLIDWLTTLSHSQAASIDTERTHKQMAAVAVSIASQVHLAALKYFSLKEEMQNSEDSLTNQWRALKLAKKKAADGGYKKLALEQVEGDLIQEQIEWTTSLGELNAALAELQAALGTNYREPVP
jgi:outer membrane protein TolC